MPGERQSTLTFGLIHDAAHRPAVKPSARCVQFVDQGGERVGRVQQIDRDEMLGDQHFTQSRIGIDTITKQTAWEVMPHAPRYHDPRDEPPSHSGRSEARFTR
jgi:hypothetical protein